MRPKRNLVRALTLILACACALVICGASGAVPRLLVVSFLDVGQGDAILLQLPDGSDILVDGGKPGASAQVVEYLRALGVQHIALLVVTHGHEDHIGGLLSVVEEFPIAEVWLNGKDCSTRICQMFFAALEANDVPTRIVHSGEAYSWGRIEVLVLNPTLPLYANDNNNSIAMRVTYGSVDILLTGDIESGAEGRLLRSGLALDAEILKVAHHGSDSSSTAAFLERVGPRDAVISVGPNPYGHPSEAVLGRLSSVGAAVWRTDEHGTVVAATDGSTYSIVSAYAPILPEESYVVLLPLVCVVAF